MRLWRVLYGVNLAELGPALETPHSIARAGLYIRTRNDVIMSEVA